MTVTLPCHNCSSAVPQELTSVTCYIQVYSGERSRMTVTLPCHTCSSAVAQGLTSVTCYAQVHSGEHSRTVVHRVGLFNKTGHITNIITQSDVVRWLQQQQGSLGELKNMTAHQLGWAGKHIKSLPARTPAIEVSLFGCVCTRLESWHAGLRPDSGAGCIKIKKTFDSWVEMYLKSLPARMPAIEVCLSDGVCMKTYSLHGGPLPDSAAACINEKIHNSSAARRG